MVDAYVGDCYCGCGTKANRVAWAALVMFFLTSVALVAPGSLFLAGCDMQVDDCLKPCHLWCDNDHMRNIIGNMAAVGPSGAVSSVALGKNSDLTTDRAGWAAFVNLHSASTTIPTARTNIENRDNFQKLTAWLNSGTKYCLYGDTFDFHKILDVSFDDFYHGDFNHEAATDALMLKGAEYFKSPATGGHEYYAVPELPKQCDFQNQYIFSGVDTNNYNRYTTSRTCCHDCEAIYNSCSSMSVAMTIVGWCFFALMLLPLFFMCCYSHDPKKGGDLQYNMKGSPTAPMA